MVFEINNEQEQGIFVQIMIETSYDSFTSFCF